MNDSSSAFAERIMRQMGVLPTSLEVVCRLMLMLRNPSQENEDVIDTLLLDRALALQVVHKSKQKEASEGESDSDASEDVSTQEIREILSRMMLQLGYAPLLRLVSVLSVQKILGTELRSYGFDRRELWMHSVLVAIIAKRFCEILSESKRENLDPTFAFIAGLMHDIGKAALNPEMRDHIGAFREDFSEQSGNWCHFEKKCCGIDHAAMGGYLLEQWKLPSEIVNAVTFHHAPSKEQKLSSIIHLADYAARFVKPPGGFWNLSIPVNADSLDACKLRLVDFERVVIHIANTREEVEQYATA
jgi:putative nucleotidyltransferase with HDIG domain